MGREKRLWEGRKERKEERRERDGEKDEGNSKLRVEEEDRERKGGREENLKLINNTRNENWDVGKGRQRERKGGEMSQEKHKVGKERKKQK